ncbi:MAG: signal peptidase I [Anaerolineae bacterium]
MTVPEHDPIMLSQTDQAESAVTEGASVPRPRVRYARWAREIIETLIVFAVVYVLVNLLTARFVVDGTSMAPSFHTGQYVIVNRVAYLLDEPQRGDIVVLHSPEDPQLDLIKRVIGLPGETVAVRDGQVFINGIPLNEPYLNAPPRYQGEWTLGSDQYFVLGDNRNNSRDSHSFGPVPRTALVGKAAAVYWPLQDARLIAHYDYTATASTAADTP